MKNIQTIVVKLIGPKLWVTDKLSGVQQLARYPEVFHGERREK